MGRLDEMNNQFGRRRDKGWGRNINVDCFASHDIKDIQPQSKNEFHFSYTKPQFQSQDGVIL